MTFTEIVTEIADRLSITSATDITRLGRAVNRRYKEVTSSLGIKHTSRLTTLPLTATIASHEITITTAEKLVALFDTRFSPYKCLEEVTLAEIQEDVPFPESDYPTKWAQNRLGSDTVLIIINVTPQTGFTDLSANIYSTVSTLSGSDEPAFPESFHDILIWGVLSDEYRKIEKLALARDSDVQFEKRISELRIWNLTTSYDVYQGKITKPPFGGGGGSGSSSSLGGTSYTQTGLILFDRDPSAPFAVTSGSAYVENLDADMLDGLHARAYYTSDEDSDDLGYIYNWEPGTLALHTVVEWEGNVETIVHGIAGATVAGQTITIYAPIGGLSFAHNSGSATVGNRFTNSVTSGSTPLGIGGYITYAWDGSAWLLVQHEQGAWITPNFSAGDFTALTAGTWTVSSGDRSTMRYRLSGNSLTLAFSIQLTTVAQSGGDPVALLINNGQWGGFTLKPGIDVLNPVHVIDNGANTTGYCFAFATGSTTAVRLSRTDQTQFANSTNATSFYGSITFEVA